jgi:protein phosphatase
MGGEAGGEVASQLTVQSVAEKVLPVVEGYSHVDIGQNLADQIEPLLQEAVNQACAAVYDRAQDDAILRRMGATVVIGLLLGRQLYVANVGDSRAYLIRTEGMTQLSKDHTVLAELIERGELNDEDANSHPAQGQLTRNIGRRPSAEIYFHHQELDDGEVVLLCCDGLTDVVQDDEIRSVVLRTSSHQEACYDLVNLANSRGGPDNITVVMTSFEAGA